MVSTKNASFWASFCALVAGQGGVYGEVEERERRSRSVEGANLEKVAAIDSYVESVLRFSPQRRLMRAHLYNGEHSSKRRKLDFTVLVLEGVYEVVCVYYIL